MEKIGTNRGKEKHPASPSQMKKLFTKQETKGEGWEGSLAQLGSRVSKMEGRGDLGLRVLEVLRAVGGGVPEKFVSGEDGLGGGEGKGGFKEQGKKPQTREKGKHG